MNETAAVDLGFIKIPKSQLGTNVKPEIINLQLDFDDLQKILTTLS